MRLEIYLKNVTSGLCNEMDERLVCEEQGKTCKLKLAEVRKALIRRRVGGLVLLPIVFVEAGPCRVGAQASA